jgi:predicted alpha/beta superfamily hydrolase
MQRVILGLLGLSLTLACDPFIGETGPGRPPQPLPPPPIPVEPAPDPEPDPEPDPDPEPEACPDPAIDLSGVEIVRDGRFAYLVEFPIADGLAPRTVRVFLPLAYDEDPEGRFPVLYAHDGQNLFDPATAAFGNEWRVDENIDFITDEGRVAPHIVVGIDNTGARIEEYTPDEDADFGGGLGDDYLQGIVDRLKPFIDQQFRTECGRADTAMMGSSLGGLITLRAAEQHGDVFGRFACLSSSFWWNGQSTAARLQASGGLSTAPERVWIDGGSEEGELQPNGLSSVLDDNREVMGLLDLPFGSVLGSLEVPGGQHNEAAWAARVGHVLRFVLGDEDLSVVPDDVDIIAWRTSAAVGEDIALTVQTVHSALPLSWPSGLVDVSASSEGVFELTPGGARALTDGAVMMTATLHGVSDHATLQAGAADQAAVGFVVQAPESTDAVFVTGSLPELGEWTADAVELSQASGGAFVGALLVPAGAAFEYKYTRGDWDLVEKDADGEELANRAATAGGPIHLRDSVARWADQ